MIDNLRKTSIVCTIGPASEYKLEEMFKAGMNVARINFSHGGKEEQREKVERIKATRKKLNLPISLMLDTQGPEIRLGLFAEEVKDGYIIEEGEELVLVNDDSLGVRGRVSITYKNLYQDVSEGSVIMVDDGLIMLKVKEIRGEEIVTVAVNSGPIKQRKGINAPGVEVKLPALKEKDIDDILYGIEAGFDYIAASFTRNKEDVRSIRKLLKENGGEDIKIISKIENQEGISKIDEILEEADGIMVARGDLSVEIPFEEVPYFQKSLIKKANMAGKPVIVATQMLESMIEKSRPTRAEVSDVANAVYDKATAVMLSGETATGKYPVECVATMAKILKNIEKNIDYNKYDSIKKRSPETLEEKVSYLALSSATAVQAAAILAYTHTGNSVKLIASIRPQAPLFVTTDCRKTYYQLGLIWGVVPMYFVNEGSISEIQEKGLASLKANHIVDEGDLLYITGGKKMMKSAADSKRIGGLAIV